MKKKSKKWFCFAGMAVLLAGAALTGCGGKKGSGQEVKMDKEHVYKANYFKAPGSLDSVNNMLVKDGKIYMDGYTKADDQGNSDFCLISVKKDGKIDTKYDIKTKNTENSYSNVIGYSVKKKGELIALVQSATFDYSDPDNVVSKETNEIVTYGADGKKKNSVKIKAKSEDGFYPNSMLADSKGNILFFMSDKIAVYNDKGKMKTEIKIKDNEWINSILQVKDKIYVFKYSGDQTKTSSGLCEVDLEKGELSDSLPFKENAFNFNFYPGDDKYDLYAKDSNYLYGYQIEGDKLEKLCNWVDSDINGSSIQNIAGVSDGQLLIYNYNYSVTGGEPEFAMIKKVDPKDVKEKKMLSLACIYADNNIYEQVIRFNKSNEDYRITIQDYSTYNTEEDYTKAGTQLRNDIISGKTPDLWAVSNNGLFNSIAAKGLLADINELMKQDKKFKRSDYLENVLDAGSKDGKMYLLIPSFDVFTFAGKTKIVGKEEGWNLDELMEVYKKQPKGTKIFSEDMTKSQILNYGCMLSMDSFMDWKKGTCNFESEEFIKLLQFTDEFPKDQKMDENSAVAVTDAISEEDKDLQYRSGKTMLTTVYLFGFEQYHQLLKVTFADDITLKGFPNASKDGSYIQPMQQIAVFDNSSEKEVCWEFLKSFLEEEYQDKIESDWPVKLSSLEKLKKKAMKPQTYKDEKGKEVEIENTVYIDGKEVNIGTLDEKECDTLLSFLKTLGRISQYDEKVNTIITEEAAAYFEGQKSAEETAKIIQDRAKTYMNENK